MLGGVTMGIGGRGFAYDSIAYASRPGLINVIASYYASYTPLEPGQETAVLLEVASLPPNANVRRFTATLDVADAGASAADATPTGVTITGGDAAGAYTVAVDTPTRPRNVTVRLDGGETFWRNTGLLTDSSYALPDFAPHVNAFLDRLHAEGAVTLQFLVSSDTPGLVRVRGVVEEHSRIQTQTWDNAADGTRRVDRDVALDFGTVTDLALRPVERTTGHEALHALTLDVSGTLGPERVLGDVRDAPAREFATVSADFFVAQQVTLDVDARLTGITGQFLVDADARLYVEIQPDADGVPATGQPLAGGQLRLAGDSALPAWRYASLDAPAATTRGTPFWIVLRGIEGRARLALDRGTVRYLGRRRLNRGGRLWRRLDTTGTTEPLARVRPVYLPDAATPSGGVEIALERTDGGADVAALRLDAEATARTFSLPIAPAGTTADVRLVARAYGRGTITVANVIQEYE